MADKFPQYADPVFRFTNLAYNITPTNIDLTHIAASGDIICSVNKDRSNGSNLIIKKYSVAPSAFSIDNTQKQIDVSFSGSGITDTNGCYYTNLWLIDENDRASSHLTKHFEVVKSVNFEV